MSEVGALPSWARVGAKVVCIDAANTPGRSWWDDAPIEGKIYTIGHVFLSATCDEVDIALVELPRSVRSLRAGFIGYRVSRFRPAVEPKTEAEDLAQFRKLLTIREPETV